MITRAREASWELGVEWGGDDLDREDRVPRFKRLITARELQVFFTPSEEERVWAEEVTDSDEHQLALLVALNTSTGTPPARSRRRARRWT